MKIASLPVLSLSKKYPFLEFFWSVFSRIQTEYGEIELYKVYSNLSQIIFSDLFVRNHSNYNLRSHSDFVIPKVKTVYKGSESLRYFGPII